ncbi:hypothetical protein BpHYR1_004107 [Brachionus plicatilis]|uniref:Uncharacterized protein n=1 Tax=Brachionus plicatilis TaxID=10195 RepID=A0A3M7R0M4_BRAPC|nr:hypothetical protein BpHYR1_004107 [Brachionus plicatilis]
MSYSKGYEPSDFYSSIENSEKDIQPDPINPINSDYQFLENDGKDSFEIDNLKKFIRNHVSKLSLILARINEINDIKLKNYSKYQEQSNFINDENILRKFINDYKSKWLKTEMRLKILEKKKLNYQLELLTVLKKDLHNDNVIFDGAFVKSDIFSYLDSHFEAKNQNKEKSFFNCENLEPESVMSLEHGIKNHELNQNNNNNNYDKSSYSDSKLSINKNGTVIHNDLINSQTQKASSLLNVYENEELPTRYIIKNIRIKIFRIVYLTILKIFLFFYPPIKPTKDEKSFYLKKILFSIFLACAMYYSVAYYDTPSKVPEMKESLVKNDQFFDSILSKLDKVWIALTSLISGFL